MTKLLLRLIWRDDYLPSPEQCKRLRTLWEHVKPLNHIGRDKAGPIWEVEPITEQAYKALAGKEGEVVACIDSEGVAHFSQWRVV